jgi:hypothetical protein
VFEYKLSKHGDDEHLKVSRVIDGGGICAWTLPKERQIECPRRIQMSWPHINVTHVFSSQICGVYVCPNIFRVQIDIIKMLIENVKNLITSLALR